MKLQDATKEELLELIQGFLSEYLGDEYIKGRLETQLHFIRSQKILKDIGEKIAQLKVLTPGSLNWWGKQREINVLNEKYDKMNAEWYKQNIHEVKNER